MEKEELCNIFKSMIKKNGAFSPNYMLLYSADIFFLREIQIRGKYYKRNLIVVF